MDLGLKGKTVIVTGGSGGIGPGLIIVAVLVSSDAICVNDEIMRVDGGPTAWVA